MDSKRLTLQQTHFMQGFTDAMRARAKRFAQPDYWQQARTLAATQPVVTSLDDAALAALIQEVAILSQQATTLVVIGTGGASLGAQALCAVAPDPTRVRFLDHCDATTTAQCFAKLDPLKTAWLIISKSGETVETLATSLALIAHYDTSHLRDSLTSRVRVITCPGTRPLRALAQQQGWTIWDHPPELGGRFCAFSNIGLFPAAFAGMDINAALHTARDAWESAWATMDPVMLEAASALSASLPEKPIHVVMAYGDNFAPYTRWYKQLWAESLGKDGRGPTAVTAIGSLDQHSQLQLYLGGPGDKCFTLLVPQGSGLPVPLAACDLPGFEYLQGHQLQDVLEASAEATYHTLAAHQLPVRQISTPFTADGLCQLMVRTFVETLLASAMLNVDPFNQPEVEEGKQRARRALGSVHG